MCQDALHTLSILLFAPGTQTGIALLDFIYVRVCFTLYWGVVPYVFYVRLLLILFKVIPATRTKLKTRITVCSGAMGVPSLESRAV